MQWRIILRLNVPSIHNHGVPKITTMRLKLLYKKHFCDILILLERAPMSFNGLEKTVGVYPDTLNKRLKEMLKYGLIEPIVDVVDGKNRVKHRLTAKGQQLIPTLKEFIKLAEELESAIFSP